MRKLIFSLFFFSAILSMNAQVQDSTVLDVKHLFTHLNTSYLNTDRLADYTLPVSYLPKFSGLYDTANNFDNWQQIYFEMYLVISY